MKRFKLLVLGLVAVGTFIFEANIKEVNTFSNFDVKPYTIVVCDHGKLFN